MSEFKIRAYGRMELAQLYSPQLTDIAAYRKDEEMDLFVSRTSTTPVRLRLRIKATLIHTVGGESHCGCFRRALNKASLLWCLKHRFTMSKA